MPYLIVMDMDGTITTNISWHDLHEYFGTLRENEKNKKLFLEGKITYEEWMERDIRLWNNPSLQEISKVLLRYNLVKGFGEFCKMFREHILVILSSGIDIRALDISRKFGIHRVFANSLRVENARVVGGICTVSPKEKGRVVETLKKEYQPEITIAIGDSEFDNNMFEKADIGISIANNLGVDIHANDFYEVISILKKLNSHKM